MLRGVVVTSLLAAGVLDGCGGTPRGASLPAWTRTLGPGVTVIPPGSNPPPGTSSPGGVIAAISPIGTDNRPLTDACQYVEPAVQAQCSHLFAGHTLPGATLMNFSLGDIAVKGTEALVGTLGTDCQPEVLPHCVTNTDPAAEFSSGRTFDQLWAHAVESGSSPVHAYDLEPCVEVGSRWYAYLSPSMFQPPPSSQNV
jgi:hypothetical protein